MEREPKRHCVSSQFALHKPHGTRQQQRQPTVPQSQSAAIRQDQLPSSTTLPSHPLAAALPPVAGRDYVQHPEQHHGIDHRLYPSGPPAPTHDRNQPQQRAQPPVLADDTAYRVYSSRSSIVTGPIAEDAPGPCPTVHVPQTLPVQPHPVFATQGSAPRPPSLALAEGRPRHIHGDGISVPRTAGAHRKATLLRTVPQQPYGTHGASPTTTSFRDYPMVAPQKKNVRASQACGTCRQLKARCDQGTPCKVCRDKGTECIYQDAVPKLADRVHLAVLDNIALMQSSLSTLAKQNERMEERMARFENLLYGISSGADVEQDSVFGQPARPTNQTAPAELLLDWEPIRHLTGHHVERVGILDLAEHPISRERNRRRLLNFGQGQKSHLTRHAGDAAGRPEEDVTGTACNTASSLAAHSERWPSPVEVGEGPHFDSNDDFSKSNVWRYVDSFRENILNMHPIIQPTLLREWVTHFLNSLPTVQPKASNLGAFQTVGVRASAEKAAPKRKRSPDRENGADAITEPIRVGKPDRPDRSIHNALVLAILALGKLCLHRDIVPDVVHHPDEVPHDSQNTVLRSPTQAPSPGHMSPSQLSELASKEANRWPLGRRPSAPVLCGILYGDDSSENCELIPGLGYFALATDILGGYTCDYTDMKNVYANIFAGMYHGQLARPVESFAFIHAAGHKLQVIMRPYLSELRRTKEEGRLPTNTEHNRLALAFWTCLQLESDLLAGLPLPSSGLLSYEEEMPHPNLALLEGLDQHVLHGYLGQLNLRTNSNTLKPRFYEPDNGNSDKAVSLIANAAIRNHSVPAGFALKDELTAKTIISARLRENYWRSQIVMYRPAIRMILEANYRSTYHPRRSNSPDPPQFRAGIVCPTLIPSAKTPEDFDPDLIVLAKKGVKALVEGTRAYHGVGGERLLTGNVFGTAHAQWGNILILAAAYKDPTLHEFVGANILETLFKETIWFLRRCATATSALRLDLYILEGLHKDLFLPKESERQQTATKEGILPRVT